MADKKEVVKQKYVTEIGELVGFINFLKPSTKYGNYTAHILLSKSEGESLVTALKELRRQQYKLNNNKGTLQELPCIPFSIYDEAKGEHIPDSEGRYLLKTGNKAFNDNGEFIFKPLLCNAKKATITGNINVGEGTKARLSVLFKGYQAGANIGISAKLLGVQIIELVEFQNNTVASLSDFDVVEGFEGVGEEFKTEDKLQKPILTADEEEEEDELGF